MTLNKAARQLRDEGRCVQCGEPLTPEEKLSRYIRCRCCRGVLMKEKLNIYQQNDAKQQEDEVKVKVRQTASTIEQRRKEREERFARCLRCPFGTFAGTGIIFCPVPYCLREWRLPKEEVEEVI